MPIPRPGASRSIVLAALRGIVAVPSLVVLAGCLAGYAETVGCLASRCPAPLPGRWGLL